MSATTDARSASAVSTWRTPLVIIICGCVIALLSFGPRSSLGFFVQPMGREFSWGRDVFGLALAVQNLLWGLGQPISGAIADRFGMLRVMCVGALLYAAGLFMMRYAATPLSLDIGAGVLIGFGLSGCSFNLVLSAFSKLLPPEKRGIGLGAERQSFRTALAEAFGHRSYVLLVLGFFTCGFQLAFITVHLPAYLSDRGVSAQTGGWVIAAIGLFNIVGSLSVGWLQNRFPKRYILSAIYFIRAVSILAFLSFPITITTAILFGAISGLTWLSTVPPTSALVALMFGTRWFATLYGFAFVSHQVGGFFGVWLGGVVFEQTGSYTWLWWLSILFGVLSALINLPIVEKPVSRPVAQPA